MANTIVLAKNYVPLLDEVYKRESVTADLTGDPAMARAGANASEIVYPQIAVTGLGDYNRNSGYTQGTVDFKWVSTKYNYDRGAKLSVDAMDNQETYNLAFGMAGAELMRTRVAPEADAFTFATLAGIDGISKGDAKTLADAKAFLEELLLAKGNFVSSDFVKGVTGVDNVCERSAVVFAQEDDSCLIVHKQKGGSVTLAVAQKTATCHF